jgi:hypothetical protein
MDTVEFETQVEMVLKEIWLRADIGTRNFVNMPMNLGVP